MELWAFFEFREETGKDLNVSIEYYLKAAELGKIDALDRLARLRDEQFVKTNIQNPLRRFYAKADEGNARAECNAGCFHYCGAGTSEDKAITEIYSLRQPIVDAQMRCTYLKLLALWVGNVYNEVQGIKLLGETAEAASADAQCRSGGHISVGLLIMIVQS